jgi:hypothetical protein
LLCPISGDNPGLQNAKFKNIPMQTAISGHLPPGGFNGGGLVSGGKLVLAQFVMGGRLVIGQFVTAGTGIALVNGSRVVIGINPLVGEVYTGLSWSSPLHVGLKTGGTVSAASKVSMPRAASKAAVSNEMEVFMRILNGCGSENK